MDQAAFKLGFNQAQASVIRHKVNHVMQYFYEPFLAVFDPEQGKVLGVWYTPREIVQPGPPVEYGRARRSAGL